MPTTGGLRPTVTPALPLREVARLAGADLTGLTASPGPRVTGVSLDSRSIQPGDLYAALPGARLHGAAFGAEAAAAGAVAMLTDPSGAQTLAGCGLPLLVVPRPREVLGELSADIYGHPAEDLLMLGVTGTNGKTTTAYLLEAALRHAGQVTGLVGTVETRVADERLDSVRTTPEATDLQALLAVMRERGCTACAAEVSSHALALHRVDGVVFDVVGFTNLSQDHLDFHADEEDYFAAKASLFTAGHARRGVVCVDDPWGVRLSRSADIPVTTLRTVDRDQAEPTEATGQAGREVQRAADWEVVERRPDADGSGTEFTLATATGAVLHLRSPLLGAFNVTNTALAAVMLVEAGLDPAALGAGLAGAVVPGRMQRVRGPVGSPLAVVDYAHTPDAVAVALRALREVTPGRLVVVLGAGGDRDVAKRPLMGAAAAAGADAVVVTDDNPRSEVPGAIRAQVLEGARSAGGATTVLEVGDRAEAIERAVSLAPSERDTVLVAGKGHERGQEVAGEVLPFADEDVVAAALSRLAAR